MPCLASPANGVPDEPDEPDERLSLVIEDLIRRGSSRPKRVASLTNTISNLFQKLAPEDVVNGLLGKLQVLGYVSFKADKVFYVLPTRRLA